MNPPLPPPLTTSGWFFYAWKTMNAPISLISDLTDRLDAELRYLFEERAGIIEFDAEQTRDQAELLALVDLLRSYPAALIGVTVLQVERNGETEFVLTTDVEAARRQWASTDISVIDVVELAEVVKTQFDGLALLTKII